MTDITKELQKALLPMLEYFHGLCEENGLRYYALGGTLLGAVRHGGFIPWDDDVDVGMPRRDYDRLIELTRGKKFDRFVFEFTCSPDPRFCYPFGKMYDTSTTHVENLRPKLVRGIYVDIFPLDGLCSDASEISALYRPVGHLKTMRDLNSIKLSKKRRPGKNLILLAARCLPPYVHAAKKLALKIDSECRKRDFEKCRFAGNLVGAWGEREIVPAEYFSSRTLLPFEGTEIYGPAEYDRYLTAIYGDWRRLPPEEKRVSHHDGYTDLDTPYTANEESEE